MSLVKPLNTTEAVDYDPPSLDPYDGDGGEPFEAPMWRTLSYDAFATQAEALTEQTVNAQPRIAAYDVPAGLRIAQVAFAVIVCWLASGIVFGYAALKPVLIAEGVYRELCPAGFKGGSKKHGGDAVSVPCPEQDLRLNLCFIAASISLNVSTVLAGTILDRYGRRVCYLISSAVLAVGFALTGAAFAIPGFDGHLVGFVLLGLGGTFVFVPSFELANAFPKRSGLIVALVTGAFDASAAVFLLYRVIYDASGARFTPPQFFFALLTIPILILIGEMTLMPPYTYDTRGELEVKIEKAQESMQDVHDSDEEIASDGERHAVRAARAEERLAELDQMEQLAGDAEEREGRRQRVDKRNDTSGVWGMLHGLPAYRQMLTPWFGLLLLLTILQMLRMNYFIATIRVQYRYMLGTEDRAGAINQFFDAALPIAGTVSTPFIGLLLNGVSTVGIWVILTFLIASLGVFNCLPYLWAAYVTVVLFVLFRPLYYSAVSDYATKVFGFATFGRIYGTLICASGLINLIQPALDVLTHNTLHGNPLPVNVFMGVAGTIISVWLATFVARAGRIAMSRRAEAYEAYERERLIPEVDEEDYGAVTMG